MENRRRYIQLISKIKTTREEIRELEAEQKSYSKIRKEAYNRVPEEIKGGSPELTLEKSTWDIWINKNLIQKKIEEHKLSARLKRIRKQLNKKPHNK